jgi:hypothetical protein
MKRSLVLALLACAALVAQGASAATPANPNQANLVPRWISVKEFEHVIDAGYAQANCIPVVSHGYRRVPLYGAQYLRFDCIIVRSAGTCRGYYDSMRSVDNPRVQWVVYKAFWCTRPTPVGQPTTTITIAPAPPGGPTSP